MITIKMAGIDYQHASVSCRELFSFSRHTCADAMAQIKNTYPIEGCVLLSTCNRTELWISFLNEEEYHINPFSILCRLKKVPESDYLCYTAARQGEDAVRHLFFLACGMESQIFGEDQIITQVKDALMLAREQETVSPVLEKLFQTAVTAAKRVKTEVRLTAVDTSVVERMIICLEEWKMQQKEKEQVQAQDAHRCRCLVIGNGEIGRLAAVRLLEQGCDVTMTLRQYKDQSATVPCGCHALPYQERLSVLSSFDVIVSGTTSPHHTLRYEETKEILDDGIARVLFDLAVPRDISFQLGELPNITLYNIDSLGTVRADGHRKAEISRAEEILETYFQEFCRWYYFREFVPIVHGMGRNAALEVYKRLLKPVRKLPVEEEEKRSLEKTAKAAVEKVISSMLYGLREELDMELWEPCFRALETALMEQIKK